MASPISASTWRARWRSTSARSTGGFTDVLLSRGAAKVYAVDVGTNQLAWKLRQDPRVIVHEQTNARNLTRDIIPEPVDIIVCDASFIGLAKVLAAALDLAKPGAKLVALVKPQFEAGREEVGKGGVVRDPGVHERVCDRGQRLGRIAGLGRGWGRREPDHRARGQCRIPAGSDQGVSMASKRRRKLSGGSRWSRGRRSSARVSQSAICRTAATATPGSRRSTKPASCRRAGCSASSGRCSTR